MLAYLDAIGLEVPAVCGGFMGSLVAVMQKKVPFWARVTSFISSWLAAAYSAKLVVLVLPQESAGIYGSAAFLIGYGGLRVVEQGLEVLSSNLERLRPPAIPDKKETPNDP